jgi:hypothetical protein
MQILKEVFSNSRNHKAIILKKGTFGIHSYKYFHGFINEDDDT